MTSIPERNLNPPPDDFEECPDCKGAGRRIVGANYVTADMASDAGQPERVGTFCGYDYQICPRCGGDGVINKREERRELEAVIGDIEHDRREDEKWRGEEEKA